MTISSSNRKAGPFVGNGATTSFPFTYKVFSVTDIVASFNAGDGTGQSTLTLDSDYSVTLNADQDADPGGTVTYPLTGDPLATGETLVVTRARPGTQGLYWSDQAKGRLPK